MTIRFVKRAAAKIIGRGESAIRINTLALSDADKAMTTEDVRALVKKGDVYAVKEKHNISANSKILKEKRAQGRRRGQGRRKGTSNARRGKIWLKKVRSQRTFLKKLKYSGKLDVQQFKHFYMLIKGNSFADKASLTLHLKESGVKVTDEELKRMHEEIKAQYK